MINLLFLLLHSLFSWKTHLIQDLPILRRLPGQEYRYLFDDRPMMRGFKEMHDEDRLSQRASQLSIKTVEEPQEAFSVDDTNVDELIITAELSVSNLDSKNDES